MEKENDRKNWNARWKRQILEWDEECVRLVEQAEMLLALIKLAKSQIKNDPPE